MRDRNRQIYNMTSRLPRKRTIKKFFWIFVISSYIIFSFFLYKKLLSDLNDPTNSGFFVIMTALNASTLLLLIIRYGYWLQCNIGRPINNFFTKIWNVFPD